MRIKLLLALILLFTSCQQETLLIKIGEVHQWEQLSARQFWYTIAYQQNNEIISLNIPVGVRQIEIPIKTKGAIYFVAYPLGKQIPLGGFYLPWEKSRVVQLDSKKGPMCEMMLLSSKKWEQGVASVNGQRVFEMIKEIDESCFKVDWNHLANDIVSGNLKESSFKKAKTKDVVITDIPQGRWVCELSSYPPFNFYDNKEFILEDIPPTTLSYLNIQEKLQLTLFISEDKNEDPFYYVGPLDPILSISDQDYFNLLN
ncbi:MAG: hypothetical protein ACOXZZ_00380 [Sphaerochaetaceae bacterium]|jgi:hypothetical protein